MGLECRTQQKGLEPPEKGKGGPRSDLHFKEKEPGSKAQPPGTTNAPPSPPTPLATPDPPSAALATPRPLKSTRGGPARFGAARPAPSRSRLRARLGRVLGRAPERALPPLPAPPPAPRRAPHPSPRRWATPADPAAEVRVLPPAAPPAPPGPWVAQREGAACPTPATGRRWRLPATGAAWPRARCCSAPRGRGNGAGERRGGRPSRRELPGMCPGGVVWAPVRGGRRTGEDFLGSRYPLVSQTSFLRPSLPSLGCLSGSPLRC